jgi:hypothetical protein
VKLVVGLDQKGGDFSHGLPPPTMLGVVMFRNKARLTGE